MKEVSALKIDRCMRLLPKIEGCSCTCRTRSNKVPWWAHRSKNFLCQCICMVQGLEVDNSPKTSVGFGSKTNLDNKFLFLGYHPTKCGNQILCYSITLTEIMRSVTNQMYSFILMERCCGYHLQFIRALVRSMSPTSPSINKHVLWSLGHGPSLVIRSVVFLKLHLSLPHQCLVQHWFPNSTVFNWFQKSSHSTIFSHFYHS